MTDTRTPEYVTWQNMKTRCNNPSHRGYRYYGGRGIRVCERWERSFADFLSDMGLKPSSEHSIDRIDPNGNYEPGNCRWAVRALQASNTRRARKITCNGETKTFAEWSRLSGVPADHIRNRLNHGYPVHEAIFKPARQRTKIKEVSDDLIAEAIVTFSAADSPERGMRAVLEAFAERTPKSFRSRLAGESAT